jgi:signal peptidase II
MTEDAPTTAPPDAAGEAPQASAPSEPAAIGADPPAQPAPSTSAAVAPGLPPQAGYRPNYLFLAVVSIVSLALDLSTKAWAKVRLDEAKSFAERHIDVLADHLSFTFAKNRGGAWGLLQDEPESIRRPFFLAISVLAIGFIVSLYRKLTPRQWALRWGLPLVLGGALGNLVNRIQYNYVVDFIDYRAGWVRWVNGLLSPHPNDHWPTFNIADVAIVAGVILMAIDMFTPTPKRPSASAAPVTGDSPAPPAPGDAGSKPQAPAES